MARNSGNQAPQEPLLPAGHTTESSAEIEVAVKSDGDGSEKTQTDLDEDAFLLPVWHNGFWAMPPGGLTRYLLRPRGFINPDVTVASDPVIANSG